MKWWEAQQMQQNAPPSLLYEQRRAELERKLGDMQAQSLFQISQSNYREWAGIDYPSQPFVNQPPPAPEPVRTEEETKDSFITLMKQAGLYTPDNLPLVVRAQHEVRLGTPEEFKKVELKKIAEQKKLVQGPPQADEPPAKILCPICAKPNCPWSF